jgi:hypothetical protein
MIRPTEQKTTFCRVCEPLCGMIATVDDGRLVSLRPDRVELSRDIMAGVVAIPHGWGHRGTGGWRVANRAGGANVNQLMSSDPADVEPLAGMARLTGVPVRVEPANTASNRA